MEKWGDGQWRRERLMEGMRGGTEDGECRNSNRSTWGVTSKKQSSWGQKEQKLCFFSLKFEGWTGGGSKTCLKNGPTSVCSRWNQEKHSKKGETNTRRQAEGGWQEGSNCETNQNLRVSSENWRWKSLDKKKDCGWRRGRGALEKIDCESLWRTHT